MKSCGRSVLGGGCSHASACRRGGAYDPPGSVVQNRALQHELHSNISKSVGIVASPVLHDACQASCVSVGVRPEDVRVPSSSVPQRGSTAEVVKVKENESGIVYMRLSPGATVPGAFRR